MKRGRKPQPAALKVARGNPGKRPIEPEIDLPPGTPERPKFTGFDAVARAEWDRVVALLPPGVLSPADQMILAGYCCSVSRWLRAEKRAAADPRDEARAERAFDAVRKAGALFGLGPAERSRVKAVGAADKTDLRTKRFFG